MNLNLLIENAPLEIQTNVITRAYERGRHIIFEGQSNDYLYLLIEGSVEVSLQSHQGKNISIRRHQAPDTFGVLELFDDQLKTKSVVAKTPCKVIIINRHQVHRWMEEDFNFNLYIIHLLTACFRQANTLATVLSTMTLKERVLLSLYQHHISGSLSQLSKDLLASEVCAPRRSLNRVLQAYQEEGLMAYEKKRFIILNPNQLEEAGEHLTTLY